jgi:hypothetical protein
VEVCDDGNNNNDDACRNDCSQYLGEAREAAARSCKVILSARPGATSGAFWLDSNAGDHADAQRVYCDMSTDGGGWTLVANTKGSTLNDQGSAYYSDLAGRVPAAANVGIWEGMRGLINGNADLRFTCKLDRNAEANTVDLSFYAIGWYRELTASRSDAAVCFEEANGNGDTQPTPARRNNVNNASLPAGDQWEAGFLEGEDSCADEGDFTVDFDNRGMDLNQNDGTDWGEDDSSKKCGSTTGGANASWQIWVREP